MVDFNKLLIRKIVRLLESEHDGERASAAGKLASMAREQKQNVDEMLAIVYGNPSVDRVNPAAQSNRYYQDPFDWGRANTDFVDAARRTQQQARDFVRRQREANERAATAAKEAERRNKDAEERRERAAKQAEAHQADRDFREHQKRTHFRYVEDSLNLLAELHEEFAFQGLTAWEGNFVTEILGHGSAYRTSPAQDRVIDEILLAYRRVQNRNGDMASFWNNINRQA